MPSTIEVTRTIYTVRDFLGWQRTRTLRLSPSFQRNPVWPRPAKSYFIDTLARGLPVPIIFIRERAEATGIELVREVVDGQQRLRTVIAFVDPQSLADFDVQRDVFTVHHVHNVEISGRSFDQLPVAVRNQILSYQFSVHVLPPDTDDREVLKIFARLNSTGIKLNAQELRNAKFFGPFKTTMYELALEQLPRWRDWRLFTEPNVARMAEVEFVSELVQMMFQGVRGKNAKALDNLYKKYDDLFPESIEISKRFRTVVDVIDDTVGRELSRSVYARQSLFHTLFTFVYEVMYGIPSKVEPAPPKRLPSKLRDALLHASGEIEHGNFDEDLLKALRGATSHGDSRKQRLEFLRSVVHDYATN